MNAPGPHAPNQSSDLTSALSPSARIIIANVSPAVDGGRYAVKRTIGDPLTVEADIFADGHEKLSAALLFRPERTGRWSRAAMAPVGNDRWRTTIALEETGNIQFRIEAWLDVFGGFVHDVSLKRDAGQSLGVEAEEGRALVEAAARESNGATHAALRAVLDNFHALGTRDRIALLLAQETQAAMQRADTRPFLNKSFIQTVQVERKAAGFAAWYELFPRSQGEAPGQHGTFRTVIAQLPRIRDMGFDVLYMPPIHPIGTTHRKGRNNALHAAPGDVGSTYAIGSPEGGHDALHPQLGTIEDFRALMAALREHDMEMALDFAVQMSPDHPWLTAHKDWFRWRPDGKVRFAENPPKKYEDIVNPDFYADPALWDALRDVLLHWIGEGVRIFRVDNPHTKPMPFWEWLIADIRKRNPDVLFLAEAFTRPKPMQHLAKLGFNQSYTYFTWRNSKRELTEYLTELNTAPLSDYFRPNFFVNTPDINPPFLQTGGRPAFLIRLALATTLSGLWGMYSGFELCEAEPLPGREEYKDSEKYELKHRDFSAPGNISAEIAQMNALRRREPALQSHRNLTFYNAFNDNILYFAKHIEGRSDRILVAINLDAFSAQECDFEIPLWEWQLPDHETLDVEDLLHGYRFSWHGKIQHLRLEPHAPYAVWRIKPHGAR